MPKSYYKKLINDFIEKDIPVAEIYDDKGNDKKATNARCNFARYIHQMGYDDLIKVTLAKDKLYFVNCTLVEEV